MQEVIKDNIIYCENTVTFLYKVEPFANLNSSESDISGTARVLERILKDINMPGGLIIKPNNFDKETATEFLEYQFDEYGNQTFASIIDVFIDRILLDSKTAHNKYFYIYFIDGRDPITPSRNMHFFDGIKDLFTFRTSNDVLKLLKDAEDVSSNILNRLHKHYHLFFKTDNVETKHVFRYLDFPTLTDRVQYHSKYEQTTISTFETRYTNLKTGNETIFHSKYLALASSKPKSRIATKGLAEVFNVNIPLCVHVKFDFQHSEEFIGEIEQKRNLIKKDNKSYEKHNQKKDYKTRQKEKDANTLLSASIKTKQEWTIRWQILIRMTYRDIDVVNECYSTTITNLRKIGFEVDTFIGRQDFAHDNFKTYINTMTKDIFITDLPFFCNLNVLGSSRCGSNVGIPAFTDYISKNRILYYIRSIRESKTKNASTTFLVSGYTGSGKSMLAFLDAVNQMIFAGYNIIFVYPKTDDVSLIDKMPMLKKYMKEYRLGDTDNIEKYKGCLDPLKVFGANLETAIFKAKELLKGYGDCYEENYSYDEAYVNAVVRKLKSENKGINMVNLLKVLSSEEFSADLDTRKFANMLLERQNHPYDSLFFGSEDTKMLDLSKEFSFIQLTNLPSISVFNRKNIAHVLTQFTITFTNELINEHIARNAKTRGNYIVLQDEYGKMSKYPNYKDSVDAMPKTLRSANSFLGIISQNNSDFPPELINNAGFWFIGTVNSLSELDYAKNHMNLSESNYNFMKARYEEKSVELDPKYKRYPFVFHDYNGNSAIIESVIYFEEIFKAFDDKTKTEIKS